MISDRMALQTVSRSAPTHALHWSVGANRVAALAPRILHITCALTSFAILPALPYAILREASMVVGFIDGADRGSDSPADRTSIHGDDGFWSRF